MAPDSGDSRALWREDGLISAKFLKSSFRGLSKIMSDEYKSSLMPDRRTFLKVAGSGAGAAVLLPRTAALAAETGYPNLGQLRARHESAGIISPQKTYRMMEWEAHTPPEEYFQYGS